MASATGSYPLLPSPTRRLLLLLPLLLLHQTVGDAATIERLSAEKSFKSSSFAHVGAHGDPRWDGDTKLATSATSSPAIHHACSSLSNSEDSETEAALMAQKGSRSLNISSAPGFLPFDRIGDSVSPAGIVATNGEEICPKLRLDADRPFSPVGDTEEEEKRKKQEGALFQTAAIQEEEIILGKKLGEGEQGCVYQGQWRGRAVVAKVLKGCSCACKERERSRRDFLNEIRVLSRIHHPNLIHFLGASAKEEPTLFLTEFMEGGNLQEFFEAKGRAWRPSLLLVLQWARDLARALCCLHSHTPPIVHRDLKPCNLLLSASGHLKLADFGLSRVLGGGNETSTYTMTGVTGTLRYMAPEVVRCEPYNQKVDIYSFSLVLWFMCTGEMPLRSCSHNDFVMAARRKQRVRPPLSRILYKPLADLMARCWDDSSLARPSALQILGELEAMNPPDPLLPAASPRPSPSSPEYYLN